MKMRKRAKPRGASQLSDQSFGPLARGKALAPFHLALTLGVLSLGLGSFSVPAMAQTGEDQASPVPILDELTVTTTGFGTPRATHTGNISKITGGETDFIDPVQPAEALNRLPGVGIQQGK